MEVPHGREGGETGNWRKDYKEARRTRKTQTYDILVHRDAQILLPNAVKHMRRVILELNIMSTRSVWHTWQSKSQANARETKIS